MTETKQIINTNFTLVVLELEALVKEGYSVVKTGEGSPYHMIMGNFIVTLTKEIEEVKVEPAAPAPVAVGVEKQGVRQTRPKK